MYRILFSLTICLLIIFTCNHLIAEENLEMKNFQLSDAIKLGKNFLIKLDPKIWDKELEIIADSENLEWKKYIEKAEKGRYDYPAMIQGRDGKLHVTYSYDVKTIIYVTFTEDWMKN